MAESSLGINVQTSAQLGGLNQTVAAINQVTAAQQKQAVANMQAQQGTGVASQFSGAVLGGLGIQTSIGGAVAALIGFSKVLIDSAGHTRDFAEQLDITTGEFQRMERASNDTAVPMRRLLGSLDALTQKRQAAAEGDMKARDAFAALGISLADLNNENVRAVDLQSKLGAATANMTDKQREAVRVLLGSHGARMLPALAAMQQLKDADMASPENLQRVDEYGKTWDRVWAGIKVAGITALGELFEAAQRFMGGGANKDGPNLAKDEADYNSQRERGLSGNARGPGKRFREYRDYRDKQNDAAAEADRAERQAEQDRQALDFGDPQYEAKDKALEAEKAKQRAIKIKAAQAAAIGYDDFHRDRPDRAPAAPGDMGYVDQAAAKALAELDKQRLENAEKRRKLEFDMLTPAQQRADIERRMREEDDIIAGDPDALRVEQAKGRQLDLQGEAAALDKKKPDALGVNQWEKLGASFGGGNGAGETLRVQQEIKQNTDRAAQQLAALNTIAQMQLSFWHQ